MSRESEAQCPKSKIKVPRSKIIAMGAFVVFGLFACTSEKASTRKEFVIAESKSYEASLFRQNCAICHGVEGNGKEIDGKLVPSLRYGDAAKRTEQEIYQQITFGKLQMPGFKGQLTDEEINKMVKFVMRDLQGR